MTLRFPVAVWQDFAGMFTASILDGASLASYDGTAAGALAQLEKYLTWALRRGSEEIVPSDFIDLEIRDHRIQTRPEYRVEETLYPVAVPFSFRVACVHGRRRDGTRHCVAPTLGIRISYREGDPINELMTESLQQALGHRTPRELSRELMPPRMMLDAVHVRPSRMGARHEGARFRTLESVATRLGTRRRGKREVRAMGRDDEVRWLASHLISGRANLLLLGESGVGKSTVLEEAIRQLQRQQKKQNKEASESDDQGNERRMYWRTSGQRLIAGMKYLGQWESRCEKVIEELEDSGGVLCVEDLLELVRAGGGNPGNSIAAFFQPYLERGELRIVAEATGTEFDACRRLLPGFADLFHVIRIPEFSAKDARSLLDRILVEGARNERFELEAGVADLIYRLFRRFRPYAAFPGRCVAFTRHLLDSRRKSQPPFLAKSAPATDRPKDSESAARLHKYDVLAEFQRETGLPERLLRDDLALPHQQVLADFRAAVLGQEAACQAAAGIVTTLKSGLNDPQRPLGVLLFCGPTGVGKTEMAKALARYLFGASGATDRMLRLDMSEYAGPGAAQRLMMSADGGPSDFIKQARRQPFIVVLLDEIEKASPEVHDVLLGLLDEGRLTDRYGRVTTFRSSVIVLTSNVGTDRSKLDGFGADTPPSFERMVLDAFRPEFVNRIDSIVTFQPLQRDTIARLVVRELESLAAREGLAKANLRLVWDDSLVEYLADAGFDLRYGARPLQRAIERLVVAPLAHWLLEHPSTRHRTITLSLAEHEIRVIEG